MNFYEGERAELDESHVRRASRTSGTAFRRSEPRTKNSMCQERAILWERPVVRANYKDRQIR